MALFELSMIGVFILVLLLVVLLAVAFWGIKHAIMIAINSVIGFFALYALKAFWLTSLVINVWSVLIVAIFGLVGLLVVLLLHWAGVWF